MDNLSEFRLQIKSLDAELLSILSKRFEICLKMGRIKKKSKISVHQPDVEQDLKKFWLESVETLHCNVSTLEPEFIEKLFDLVLAYSKKIQTRLSAE